MELPRKRVCPHCINDPIHAKHFCQFAEIWSIEARKKLKNLGVNCPDLVPERLTTTRELRRRERILRSEAQAAGAIYYQMLIPCPSGHLGFKYVINNFCMGCRKRRGKKTHNTGDSRCKLTETQVLEIIDWHNSGKTNASIAAHYGVTATSVWQIMHRKSWVHLTSNVVIRGVNQGVS